MGRLFPNREFYQVFDDCEDAAISSHDDTLFSKTQQTPDEADTRVCFYDFTLKFIFC